MRACGTLRNRSEAGRNLVEGGVPGDSFEPPCPGAFRADASERKSKAIGVISPFEIAVDFVAEKTAGEWRFGIAADSNGDIAGPMHLHRAGIGAIMRADGAMNGEVGHTVSIEDGGENPNDE